MRRCTMSPERLAIEAEAVLLVTVSELAAELTFKYKIFQNLIFDDISHNLNIKS